MRPVALITGASGFSGYHLRHELAADWDVVCLDRSHTQGDPHIVCDITDREKLERVIQEKQPDAIFHLAGLIHVHTKSAEVFYRINGLGTLNLLEAVRLHAPQARVLLVTSSAMYGRPTHLQAIFEEDHPIAPVNAYGVSKAMQHLLGFQYFAQYDLQIIRACPFNLVGPRLAKGLVASDFAYQLAAIEAGLLEPVIEVGDLNAGRDFLDVRDAVHAYHLLIQKGQAGESYNIASQNSVVVGDLLQMLIDLSGLKVEVKTSVTSKTSSLIPTQIGSKQKLYEITHWEPRISLEQSLADTLNYWRELIHQKEV